MTKRNTAFKLWIENLNNATPIFDSGKFVGLRLGEKIVQRVNLIANVIDKFEGENFSIITIDDSTGIFEIRDFENGLKDIEIGDTILVIGTLKYYNEKVYIIREIIKKIHPLWLVARKLELEKLFDLKQSEQSESQKTKDKQAKDKDRSESIENIDKSEELKSEELKALIIEMIKKREEEKQEVSVEDVYLELNYPIEDIKNALEALMEEAKIYEPRPGILKTF